MQIEVQQLSGAAWHWPEEGNILRLGENLLEDVFGGREFSTRRSIEIIIVQCLKLT